MGKIKDLVIDVDLSDELNVNETKHNVLNLFEKYRNYKFMENAIIARRSSSLNFDTRFVIDFDIVKIYNVVKWSNYGRTKH